MEDRIWKSSTGGREVDGISQVAPCANQRAPFSRAGICWKPDASNFLRRMTALANPDRNFAESYPNKSLTHWVRQVFMKCTPGSIPVKHMAGIAQWRDDRDSHDLQGRTASSLSLVRIRDLFGFSPNRTYRNPEIRYMIGYGYVRVYRSRSHCAP